MEAKFLVPAKVDKAFYRYAYKLNVKLTVGPIRQPVGMVAYIAKDCPVAAEAKLQSYCDGATDYHLEINVG